MLGIDGIHHIAIICSDYAASKKFYTEVLGFVVVRENYRTERNSFKLDLKLGERYVLELFSFPDAPRRPSRPEACGLRHLAFDVTDLKAAIHYLQEKEVPTEPVRTDPYTGKRFTFFSDPDHLPLELYEK